MTYFRWYNFDGVAKCHHNWFS